MDSLQSLDTALFRFVNQDLSNRFFDWAMPVFNSSPIFLPGLVLLAVGLIWKGGVRGRLLVFFLLLTFVIGDPVIVRWLKRLFDRSRPFVSLSDIHLLVGRTDKGSMPSGHAANWFAAMVVALVYYRRTVWFMLPMAVAEAFSRVYLGVHYPSDVLAGAFLGITYSIVIMWASDALWRLAGPRLFPLWWRALPSFLNPDSPANLVPAARIPLVRSGLKGAEAGAVTLDQHWIRLGWLLIGLVLAGHLIYLASDKIELTEDEAYQWLWSKHLALSYYSKPPLIAYTQFLGTRLWGDTEFGIRFFSPVLAALSSALLLRFLAREVNGYTACMSVVVATATPLLMVGAILMTIDSLSVLFWLAATLSGWLAVHRDSTRAWLWTGLWMGLGFLSKYTAAFQWFCWAVLLVLSPRVRAQLRRPGPYVALVINAVCAIPVLLWNAQNHWITVTHLADRGGLDKSWQPTLRFLWDFVGSEAALLNPIFFVAMVWAGAALWRRPKGNLLMLYLFGMGAPLFLFYLCYTLRARVQPNWIAPSILPLFCVMLAYWDERRRQGARAIKHFLVASLALGWIVVIPLHDTNLIAKAIGKPLSVPLDPLSRVLGWKEIAKAVQQARSELAAEGKPVFIIGSHYGVTSLLSFYIPEAKKGIPESPLVYCESSDEPRNQFFFWPGYGTRKGQNAIYIAPVDRPESAPSPRLREEFVSVTDLGAREILYKGRVFHRIHLFACRDER